MSDALPVTSLAKHNRGRNAHIADGILVTPSHNPPEDAGFKYDPPNVRATDKDGLIYAETFGGAAHLDALVSEAQEIVGTAIGDRT